MEGFQAICLTLMIAMCSYILSIAPEPGVGHVWWTFFSLTLACFGALVFLVVLVSRRR